MTTPTPAIRRCLDARLVSLLPGLGLDAGADVAWPNAAFVPDASRLYLRPTCMFNPTNPASLGTDGFERLAGIYQIDVFDVQDTGLGRAEELARALVDAFRGGSSFACCGFEVRVRTAYAGTPRKDNDRLHIPVSAAWYCYAQK